jgi:hypothetical protein
MQGSGYETPSFGCEWRRATIVLPVALRDWELFRVMSQAGLTAPTRRPGLGTLISLRGNYSAREQTSILTKPQMNTITLMRVYQYGRGISYLIFRQRRGTMY